MKFLMISLAALLCGGALGQMSRENAERYTHTLNGPVPYSHEALIWSLTSSDEALASALEQGRGEHAQAAAVEAYRRKLNAAMIQGLPHADLRSAGLMLFALSRVNSPEARKVVENATRHPERGVRWGAANASARWGYKGARPMLLDAIRHDQTGALEALALVGRPSDAKDVRAYYERAAKQPYSGFGENFALTALLTLGKLRDPWGLSKLRAEVDHPSETSFRGAAAQVLGEVGMHQDFPRLMRLLSDPDMHVRFASAEALGRAGAKSAVPALRKLASHAGGDSWQGRMSDAQGREYVDYAADSLENVNGQ